MWPTVTIKKEKLSIHLPEEVVLEIQKLYDDEYSISDIKWVGNKTPMRIFKHFSRENIVDKQSRSHIEITFQKMNT